MTSSSRFNELFFPLGVIGDKVAPVSNPSHEMTVREGILLLAVSKPGLPYVLMARRANQVVRNLAAVVANYKLVLTRNGLKLGERYEPK